MKILLSALLLSALLSSCIFFQPDYVRPISADELNGILKKKDIFLVDVHIPEQQHIKGTDLFVPYNNVEANLQKFPADKTTPLYLYCEGGPMGNAAARVLHKNGYQTIYNLVGGTDAWHKRGYQFQE